MPSARGADTGGVAPEEEALTSAAPTPAVLPRRVRNIVYEDIIAAGALIVPSARGTDTSGVADEEEPLTNATPTPIRLPASTHVAPVNSKTVTLFGITEACEHAPQALWDMVSTFNFILSGLFS